MLFPKNERIVAIDFSCALSGNQNRYPFNHYSADIELVITAPAKKKAQPLPEDTLDQNADPLATTLSVGASDLDNSEPVPIKENFVASIPGSSSTERSLRTTPTSSCRPQVVTMVLYVSASPCEMNLLPLSLCVSLIFGLPALRNIQPGVPPIGGFSDFLSFLWAEMMVSISGIALAWIWFLRSKKDRKTT